MSAAGAIDSGVDTTSNESNDLNESEGVMTEIRVITEDFSSGMHSHSMPECSILGTGGGVGCNRISLKDADAPPPPPPPTSPNICGGPASHHTSDEDVNPLIHNNRDELLLEETTQSCFHAEHGSNNEDSEAMERDINCEDFESFTQSPTNVAIDSDSGKLMQHVL